MGDALGHSWVGLLLARAIDPALQTPVPLAFTYKLLVRKKGREGGREGGYVWLGRPAAGTSHRSSTTDTCALGLHLQAAGKEETKGRKAKFPATVSKTIPPSLPS